MYKKIGNAYFREQMDIAEFADDKELIENSGWSISNNDKSKKYNKKISLQIFNKIHRADILCLDSLQTIPKILITIIPVYFPVLRELWMPKDDLQNIQAVVFLNCPVLEELRMAQNRITNAKSIRKIKCNQLKTISLRGNPIADSLYFNELNAPQLKEIFLELTQSIIACENALSFIANWESNALKRIVLNKSLRVSQKSVLKMLGAKCNDTIRH